MAEIKLTKNELKSQKTRLEQLQKYLPTLQLKKALLQAEVVHARNEYARVLSEQNAAMNALESASELISAENPVDVEKAITINKVDVEYENIAGADLPKFKQVIFSNEPYDIYDSPAWTDSLIEIGQSAVKMTIALKYTSERLAILEKELREVSIRVNLFDKVLIPRCTENIKKIRIFLGDLQLSQVGQAKAAKAKIIQRKNILEKNMRAAGSSAPTATDDLGQKHED